METFEIAIQADMWTKVGDAGKQYILTPQTKGKYILRYSSVLPTVDIGHIVECKNVQVGSSALADIYVKSDVDAVLVLTQLS